MQRPDSADGSGSASGSASGGRAGSASGADERWTQLDEPARGESPVMVEDARGEEHGGYPDLKPARKREERPDDQHQDQGATTRTPSFHVQQPSGDAAVLVEAVPVSLMDTQPIAAQPAPAGRFTTFMQARRPRSRQASDQSGTSHPDEDGSTENGRGEEWKDAGSAGSAIDASQAKSLPAAPLRSVSGGSTASITSRETNQEKDKDRSKPSRAKTLRKKTSRLFSSSSSKSKQDEPPRVDRTVSSGSGSTSTGASARSAQEGGSPQFALASAGPSSGVPAVPSTATSRPASATSSASHRQLPDPFLRGNSASSAQQHRRRASAASSSETSFLSIAVGEPITGAALHSGSAPKPRRGSSGSGGGGGTGIALFRSRSKERERDDERVLHSVAEDGPATAQARRPGGAGQAGNLPQRMSAWFGNMLPNGAQGQGQAESSNAAHRQSAPPALTDRASALFASPSRSRDPQGGTASPSRKIPGAGAATNFLAAARQKAVGSVRYLLDSEAHPDGCEDPIWVMGVRHGYEGMEQERPDSMNGGEAPSMSTAGRKTSHDSGSTHSDASGQTASTSGVGGRLTQLFGNTGQGAVLGSFSPGRKGKNAAAGPDHESPSRAGRKGKEAKKESVAQRHWPRGFHEDFHSILWCTYRSQYAPISALPPHLLLVTPDEYASAVRKLGRRRDPAVENAEAPPALSSSVSGSRPSGWAWVAGSNEKGLTSDAGWGCMLRTGQSMLANALIHLHLGREWKRSHVPDRDGPAKEVTAFTTYTQILTWFLDDPSPACPFSVHRMALIGKQLGKEIGEWFGPSTAAGAIKILTNNFDPCGLAVSVAADGIVFRSDVLQASHSQAQDWQDAPGLLPRRTRPLGSGQWGEKAVLVLVGVRLGLEGVNPIYHDSIKALFTFPQSVGIAGGRPSSSYYFVGTQANSLYYLDPHTTRPAVPLPSGIKATEGEQPDRERLPRSSTITPHNAAGGFAMLDEEDTTMLDAYDPADLATFHSEKVKRMAISGMDPSMLLGFLCKDETDWLDLVQRLNELKHKVVTVQDQPPTWDSDDFDAGMESFSEADLADDDQSLDNGGPASFGHSSGRSATVQSVDDAPEAAASTVRPARGSQTDTARPRREPGLEESLTTLAVEPSSPQTPTRGDTGSPITRRQAAPAASHSRSASHSADSLSRSFDRVGRDEIDMLDTPLPQTGFFEETGTGDKVVWEAERGGAVTRATAREGDDGVVLVRKQPQIPE